MIDRATKLRLRRLVRRRKRQVEDLSVQAEEQLEQHFFKRLGRLVDVRRFLLAWIMLFVFLMGGVAFQNAALSQYYQTVKPVAGGTYTEGILGSFTDANPLYAVSPVDVAVSKLVFASLLRYDQQGKLVGDMAEKWAIDERGTTFTVTLRSDLQWHDGQPLTADDVVFTYQTIQKADARSPLFASWQGIQVQAINPKTINFVLPNTLASFPASLTNGIVPKHLLEKVPAAQLRSITFNTVNPVGSGPFKFGAIEVSGNTPETRQEQIGFTANDACHAGRPQLDRYQVRTFRDEKTMIASFEQKELNAMSGLNVIPDELESDSVVSEYNVPIAGEVGVFFRTSHEILNDVKVRQALVRSIDHPDMLKDLGYPVLPVRGPLLSSHVAYNKDLLQLPYDIAAANKLLDEAGWIKGKDGVRAKGSTKLTFRLFSQNTSEYTHVTQKLQAYWKEIGVKTTVLLLSDVDLQKTASEHTYDALLYGITLGLDPDVFAYWHSSQADIRATNRVNFSEYNSKTVDTALEAGRTRLEPELRTIKYRPFLEAWRNDAPAAMLYQPRYLYVTRGTVYGFDPRVFNSGNDRYANVHEWMVKIQKVTNE